MKIRVFSEPNDPYSYMLKNLLISNNLEFENIECINEERKKELKEISGQTKTPVIEIDGKVYVGFDREQIKKVLGLASKQ